MGPGETSQTRQDTPSCLSPWLPLGSLCVPNIHRRQVVLRTHGSCQVFDDERVTPHHPDRGGACGNHWAECTWTFSCKPGSWSWVLGRMRVPLRVKGQLAWSYLGAMPSSQTPPCASPSSPAPAAVSPTSSSNVSACGVFLIV